MTITKAAKKREHWKEIIDDFEDSGLSKASFCHSRSISRSSFDYYLSLSYKADKDNEVLLPADEAPPSYVQEKEDWNKLIHDWRQSGQSQSAFCRARGIVYSQFKYHHQCFYKKSIQESIAMNRIKNSASFIPVTLDAPGVNGHPVEIHFPSGVIIKTSQQESLTSIIQALGAHL